MGNFKTNGCVGALMKTLFTKLPRIVNVDKNINNIGKCVSLSNKGEASTYTLTGCSFLKLNTYSCSSHELKQLAHVTTLTFVS